MRPVPRTNDMANFLDLQSVLLFAATLVDFQMEIFTNSFVAHLAKWMQLNFQACMKFHENSEYEYCPLNGQTLYISPNLKKNCDLRGFVIRSRQYVIEDFLFTFHLMGF